MQDQPAKVSVFLVLAFLLPAWWGANLAVGFHYNSQELFPMSAYPMFSTSQQRVADDYQFWVQPENGSAVIQVPGQDMFHAHHSMEISPARNIYRYVIKSVDSGCAGARLNAPCTGDPADWEVPPAYANMWTGVARERLGLAHDPHALTFVKIEVPIEGGSLGQQVVIPIFRYEPATATTQAHPEVPA